MTQVNPSAPVNSPEKTIRLGMTKFPDFKYHLANTPRFAEASPCFAAEALPKDEIPMRDNCNLRTYSLKAPLMADVFHRKLYFAVPDEAVLPLNFEKLYKNPKQGDDVDATLVGTSVPNFVDIVKNAFNKYKTAVVNENGISDELKLERMFKYLVGLEYIFSAGSLLNILGCKLWKFCLVSAQQSIGRDRYLDEVFDEFCNAIIAGATDGDYLEATIQGQSVKVNLIPGELSKNFSNVIEFRQFLDKIRDTFDWSFTDVTHYQGSLPLTKILPDVIADPSPATDKKPIDLKRCFCYQMGYASFMTNPNVDNIFNCELYRQNVRSVLAAYNALASGSHNFFPYTKFTYNGLTCEYDILSGYNFSAFAQHVSNSSTQLPQKFALWFEYLNLIFGIRRTLRYADYFTGAKTRRLAVGNTMVGVVNNQVDVIDITRNIQKQRFLNQVNRLPGRMYDYVKGLFGISQQQDFHECIWLAVTEDKVFDSEVENTGSAQQSEGNSVTATLRQSSGNFCFQMDYIDRPMTIIGIEYFDIPRYYDRMIERPFFHVGRFDWFNPLMQYTGDQQIYADELDATKSHAAYFGYQQKYMEYKQRVNQACGAFCLEGVLPGYLPIADEGRNVNLVTSIGPDYIRSTPSDFDKFYVALTGYSRGTYFHFIVDHNNLCEPTREMAFNPQIL